MTNGNGGIPKAFGRPTGSEEWMLNLLDFFLFLFKKMHYSCREGFNTPKHRKEWSYNGATAELLRNE